MRFIITNNIKIVKTRPGVDREPVLGFSDSVLFLSYYAEFIFHVTSLDSVNLTRAVNADIMASLQETNYNCSSRSRIRVQQNHFHSEIIKSCSTKVIFINNQMTAGMTLAVRRFLSPSTSPSW